MKCACLSPKYESPNQIEEKLQQALSLVIILFFSYPKFCSKTGGLAA